MSLIPGDGGLKPTYGAEETRALAEVVRALADADALVPPGGIRIDNGGNVSVGLPDGTVGPLPSQAARTRALLVTHMETLDGHHAVQRAMDHALEAFDRYCEQEGLS